MKTSSYLLITFAILGFLDNRVPVALGQETATDEIDISETTESTTTNTAEEMEPESTTTTASVDDIVVENPVQSGPFIDLLGEQLYSLKMLDDTRAEIVANYTNEILAGKKVVGLYFSADWCGPCRQFTPDLVKFYERMNKRRGKKDQFEIVWISRCRDTNSYVQYFSHMPWLALPPEEAMGERGQKLGQRYNVKGIPSFVLVDDLGQTITIDAVTKLRQDKTGIGFP